MADPARESTSDSAAIPTGDMTVPQSVPAYKSAASLARFLIPAAIGLTADLWLKAWSFPDGVPKEGPAGRHPVELVGADWAIIPNVLAFQTTVNHGMVFGIAQGMAFYFLLFSIVAMGMILWVFATSRSTHWIVHIALGMITAGALGNLYDRAMYNGVRDMLRFYVSWYPYIFNIADVMLCVGVPLLMARWLFVKDPAPTAKPEAAPR
jgi:signal peptidase II